MIFRTKNHFLHQSIINKVGKFCKVIEDNNSDGFKIAFDGLMMDSIDDMNKCVEAVSAIANNVNSVLFIMYDILSGNKFIKKNKEGKIDDKWKILKNMEVESDL